MGVLFAALASCGAGAQTPTGSAAAAGAQGPKPLQRSQIHDAPHLFFQKDGSVVAKWVVRGKLKTKAFAKDAPIELPEFAHLLGDKLTLAEPKPPKWDWQTPQKMLALSDVEGEYDALLKFLRNNKVVDDKGRWSFGKGHLVGVGDMVDRGDQVTEVLLLFYRLSLEAEAAGGHVHYVLGNHEAMMMGGDVRYTHPKYGAIAQLMGIRVEQLVGADTVIGRWMRSCNCVERVGDYVFVHAGLSPWVAGPELAYDKVNGTVRKFLGVPPQNFTNATYYELCWGAAGPLWYRGYFAEHSLTFGPTPTAEQFAKILKAAGGKHIVVGHTKVPVVRTRFDGGLIPIDVPWTMPKNVRALVLEDGKVRLTDIEGKASPLN